MRDSLAHALLAALLAAPLAGGCTVGGSGGFEEAACTDAGECFDAMPDAARDVMADPDGAPDAAPPDVAPVDALPIDALPIDAAPVDAAIDAAPDAAVDAAPDPAPDAGAPLGPVDSCAEIDSSDCFGHPDCPDGQRCEDVGRPDAPVPCCVPGRRGDIEPGGSCADVDGQIECRSGVCIEDVDGDDVCSSPCEGAGDCPASLPRCVVFPFGGTDFMWCFPE